MESSGRGDCRLEEELKSSEEPDETTVDDRPACSISWSDLRAAKDTCWRKVWQITATDMCAIPYSNNIYKSHSQTHLLIHSFIQSFTPSNLHLLFSLSNILTLILIYSLNNLYTNSLPAFL